MEPTSITAGTTAEWSRTDAYAYGLWTYQYVLTGPQQITVNATAAGGAVTAEVSASTTDSWPAGKYQWFLWRENGTQKHAVDTGYIEVRANPFGQTGSVDHSTHAERMLYAIEARLENRAVSDYEQYSIDGRSLARIPVAELMRLRDKYRNEVARQKRREAGKQAPRRVIYRMP